MIPITAEELALATGGRLICSSGEQIKGVTTDSRKIKHQDLFIPLIGDNNDGHEFITQALNSGACAVLTSRPIPAVEGKTVVFVSNTHTAMQSLASYIRSLVDIPIIAVIGSVGKTTTKDMIASILSQRFHVLKTDGNFNNDIGVPLTLFNLEREHECAVIEMGMNHFGEMRVLAKMVRPKYVVMTNIGDAHIENLGSRQGILKAKSEVFEFADPNGYAILNGDDVLLESLHNKIGIKTISCGENANCDVIIENVDTRDGMSVTCSVNLEGDIINAFIPTPGRHMIYSAAQGACVARKLGMTNDEIAAGIKNYKPTGMRMNVKNLRDNIILISDAYNANPQSMEASLKTLCSIPAGKKIAVLGDMLELGDISEEAHSQIGDLCRCSDIDIVFTCGDYGRFIAAHAGEKGHWYEDRDELASDLLSNITPGTAIDIKASRGMHFEFFIKSVEEKYKL